MAIMTRILVFCATATTMAYGVGAFDGFDFKSGLETVKFEVDNLNGFHLFGNSGEYNRIFEPLFRDSNDKRSAHSVHVVDKRGLFMKLHYHAQHHDDAEVLKLDELVHQSKVTSVICLSDENNTIELGLQSHEDAMNYLAAIEQTFDHQKPKGYFLTAGHEWRCSESNGRYDSVMRKVTKVYLDEIVDSKLILQTEEASLVDIFPDLELDFSTNVGMLQRRNARSSTSTGGRKLLKNGGVRKLFKRWTNGLFQHKTRHGTKAQGKTWRERLDRIKKDIEHTVEAVAGTASFAHNQSLGLWQWNYNETTNEADYEYSLYADGEDETSTGDSQYVDEDSAGGCTNCYAFVKGELQYKLSIKNYKVHFLRCVLDGLTELSAEFSGEAQHGYSMEETVVGFALPDVGFKIFGIKFGVFIDGLVEVGVKLSTHVDRFLIKANGHIKKGFQYYIDESDDYPHWEHIYEHSFAIDHEKDPLPYESFELDVSVTPTMQLSLKHVGSIGLGFHFCAEFNFKIMKDKCHGVYVTPKFTMTPILSVEVDIRFAGGDFLKWDSDWTLRTENFQEADARFTGCVQREKLLQSQSQGKGEVDDDGRRRLVSDTVRFSNSTQVLIDLSQVSHSEMLPWSSFGLTGDRWWANMTMIPKLCTHKCNVANSSFPILSARNATIFVEPLIDDSSQLIAVFQAAFAFENDPSSDWNDNIEVFTTLSCISRYQLDLTVADIDDVPTYDVLLLEWSCDSNLTMLGLHEYANDSSADSEAFVCMITLPSQLNAMTMDSSLGNIMLFDSNWCAVFSLMRRSGYDIAEQIKDNRDSFQFPSKLWYGKWSCGDPKSHEMELYFQNYDPVANSVTAWLVELDGEDGTELDTWYINGTLSWEHKNMTLKILGFWYADELSDVDMDISMDGALNVLSDGTITYSGGITFEGFRDCAGFVFQGYLNLSQFDSTEEPGADDSDVSSANLLCVAHDDHLIIGVAIAALALSLCSWAALLLVCSGACSPAATSNATSNVEMSNL